MRKLTVLAMLAAVLMAGSAFAVNRTIQPNATFTFGVGGAAIGPTTTNNDDTCDIGTAPAATLLLPYFEVDFKSQQGTARTTLFTITNVSNLPQIAHVVVWTDWSFPVLDFNIFLTGYDVQAINLYDVIARGIIAPPSGTSSNITVPSNPTAGSQPADSTIVANPNLSSLAACTALPGAIPPGLLTCLQTSLTTGVYTCGCTSSQIVGGAHANAIGYITVDLTNRCHTDLPNQAAYFPEILFDNVLIGDYQDVNPNPATGNFAGGNPMVHLRAIPEGGPAGTFPGTNLPNTFYDRYTSNAATGAVLPDRRFDRRQPLPSTFAARFIQGGTGSFNTNYKIWREGITVGTCTGAQAASLNSNLGFTEFVKFDEHENANIAGGGVVISPAPLGAGLPETSSQPTTSAFFPPIPAAAGDIAGWTYLNLHNGGSVNYSRDNIVPAGVNRASGNWVIVHMEAEARYSVDFDAAWLGNGCSPPTPGGAQIGPAGGVLVCPLNTLGVPVAGCTPGVAPFTGTNSTPP